MTSTELKLQLNEDYIIKILDKLDCHHIKVHTKYITCGLRDGDNPSSVCVYIDNQSFYTSVHTRSEFENKPYKDIITLVEFIESISAQQAIKFICNVCGFNYYAKVEAKPQFLQWLDFVETGATTVNDDVIAPLPMSILNQFIIRPVFKWQSEGIELDIQRQFKIGLDIASERIIIPITDEIGNLVGVKGRLFDDAKIINDKYIYLYNCPKSKILFGLYDNYKHIKEKNEVIVVESEKNVLKLNSLGFNNTVAIGGKTISKTQMDKLMRLCVPITLAFDKDVTQEEIKETVKELKSPIILNDVHVIYDSMDFLSAKESPCDDADTWDVLYSNFKYKA